MFQDELADPTLAGTLYSAVPLMGAKRFGIAIRFQCGITENAGISGLSSVLAKSLGQDSPGKTGPLLAAELGALGGFGIVDDSEAITIWGVCSKDPADIQETIQVVLSDLAIKPRIDDSVVQRARWMAMQRKALDAGMRATMLQKAVRASGSGTSLVDTLNPVIDRRVDTTRVLAHHSKWFHPTRAMITVMGGFNPREIREVVRWTLSLAGWDERGTAPKAPISQTPVTLPASPIIVNAGPGPQRALVATGLRPVTSGLPTLTADTLAFHYLSNGRTSPLYKLRIPNGDVYDIRGDVAFTAGGYIPYVEVVTAPGSADIAPIVSTALRDAAAKASELREADLVRAKDSYLRNVTERVNRMPSALLDATQRQHIGLAAWDRDVERLVKGTSKEMVVSALKRIENAMLTAYTTGGGAGIG